MDLMVITKIVLVLNGNYNGVYWYVMDPIGKMPKTHYKNELCNGFTGKS